MDRAVAGWRFQWTSETDHVKTMVNKKAWGWRSIHSGRLKSHFISCSAFILMKSDSFVDDLVSRQRRRASDLKTSEQRERIPSQPTRLMTWAHLNLELLLNRLNSSASNFSVAVKLGRWLRLQLFEMLMNEISAIQEHMSCWRRTGYSLNDFRFRENLLIDWTSWFYNDF